MPNRDELAASLRDLRDDAHSWRGLGGLDGASGDAEEGPGERAAAGDAEDDLYEQALGLAGSRATKYAFLAKPQQDGADGLAGIKEQQQQQATDSMHLPLPPQQGPGPVEMDPRWMVQWPERPGCCDYALYFPRSLIAWFRLLGDNYGWNYMSFIMVFVMGNFIPTVLDYVYRSFNAPSILVQSMENVSSLPLLLSPLLGLMVNLCPIMGWHFNPYIIMSTLVGVVGYIVIGAVPAEAYLGFEKGNTHREVCFPIEEDAPGPAPDAESVEEAGLLRLRALLQEAANVACEMLPQSVLGTVIVGICATFVVFSAKVPDNIIQGVSAAKIKRIPAFGPDLATFNVQFFLLISLLQFSFAGALIENLEARYGYLIGAVMISLILFNVWRNSIGEKRLPPELRGFRWDKVRKHRKTIVFAFMLGLLGVMQALASLLLVLLAHSDTRTLTLVQFLVSIAFLGFVIGLMFYMLPKRITLANVWIMINAACAPTAGQATFYFFSDSPEAYPDGPHFSAYILATALPLVSLGFSFLGTFLYVKFMPNWKYRFVITLNIAIMSTLNFFDVVFFLRWNKRIGIPDLVFLLGAQALPSAFVIMTNMPLSILMNQLTPHKIEATAMAIMTCCQTFGQNAGKNMGSLVNAYLGVNPSGQPGDAEQFKYLWVNPVLNIALSVVVAWPLVFFMIPDARQTDNLSGAWKSEEDDAASLSSKGAMGGVDDDEIVHPDRAAAVGKASDPVSGLHASLRRMSYEVAPISGTAPSHASMRRTSLDWGGSAKVYPKSAGAWADLAAPSSASVTGVPANWAGMPQGSNDSATSSASMVRARRNRRDATFASLRAAAASMGQTAGLGRGGGANLIQSTAPSLGPGYGGTTGGAYNDASMRLVAANAARAAELDFEATQEEDLARSIRAMPPSGGPQGR